MKIKAKQVLDAVIELLMSGKLIPITLNQPICKHSYFLKVAKDWGIAIEWIPKNKHHVGSYHHGRKKIYLTTNDRIVFYHELGHAGILKFFIGMVDRYYSDALAEVIAQTLYFLAHGKIKSLKRTNRYIEYYSKKLKKIPFEVLGEIREDAESLIEVILTPDPIFKVVSAEREKPMFFKMMIEAELFRMVFKKEHISIEIVSKDDTMDLENDFPVNVVHKKGNQWEKV